MEELLIGIDLTDVYTQAAVEGREDTWQLPTVICRKKSEEEWSVGEDAYRYALTGDGVIVDKLLSLAVRDGTATISDTKYTGRILLGKYLEILLSMILAEYEDAEISELVIALEDMEMKLMDELSECLSALGIDRSKIHFISHTECFVYYVLSQKRDVWGGQVGMFSLYDEDLRYYELKVVRGPRQMTAYAEYEKLEESFSLNVLDTPSGAKMADKILCACADRFLQKRLFSAIFLTGRGFTHTDWAPDFMKEICSRRRVFSEPAMYAKGAAIRAGAYIQKPGSYPFICLCEGNLRSTVSIDVIRRDTPVSLALASAGENWYEARSVCEVILDGQNSIDLTITPAQDPKQKRQVTIPLEEFPERPDKTTKVRIAVGFLDEKTMAVKVIDRGFGELFPKTDAQVRREVML